MEGRCFIKGRWGADSPVESEGGHKGGGGLFQGSLIRGRLRIGVWELI